MKTITLKIKRPNNQIETIDVTDKFPKLDQSLFDQIKKATKQAGKGDLINAEIKVRHSNIKTLVDNYNKTYNEGAEGYMPSEDYFTSKPEFKTWYETTTIK